MVLIYVYVYIKSSSIREIPFSCVLKQFVHITKPLTSFGLKTLLVYNLRTTFSLTHYLSSILSLLTKPLSLYDTEKQKRGIEETNGLPFHLRSFPLTESTIK